GVRADSAREHDLHRRGLHPRRPRRGGARRDHPGCGGSTAARGGGGAPRLPFGDAYEPRNVMVFSVTILPVPWYSQISYTAEPMSPLASKSTGLNAPS